MTLYTEKKWDLAVKGLSGDQINYHFKLYGGYVNNANILQTKITQFIQKGDLGSPEYNELKRRFGWEYNGVRLHELYFDNLASGEKIDLTTGVGKKIIDDFGNYDAWIADFKKTGAIRGIGWVILYQDNVTKNLYNVWIENHHVGHPADATPLLVMDVWEHAYCVDWNPTERGKYIDVFFDNIKWSEVYKRFG
jgi:Fe-Mn family superoxide dismutase